MNISPTNYSISTMTSTVYTNIPKINVDLILELYANDKIFQEAPIEIGGIKRRFKNCVIVKIIFPSETKKQRRVAVNIFNTGNFHVTGTRENDEIVSVMNYLCDEFLKCGVIETSDLEIDIQTRLINSNYSLPLYNVDLHELYNRFKKDHVAYFSKYNPNNHPGVQLKIPTTDNVDVSCFVFGTGSILITGSRNLDQLDYVYDFLVKYLDNNFKSFCHVKPPAEPKIPMKRGRKRKVIELM